MGSSTPRSLLLALLALLGPTACKAKIGDGCLRSTDCSIRGERVCDLSHRVTEAGVQSTLSTAKGECTIDGCGRDTCPKEAACIKVYGSDFLSVACDPEREDVAVFCEADPDACEARGCLPSIEDGVWTCPPRDDCQANEVCLPEGLCADELTARTSCRRKCSGNDDCRAGYECVLTGSQGVYHAPDIDEPNDPSDVRICMPER